MNTIKLGKISEIQIGLLKNRLLNNNNQLSEYNYKVVSRVQKEFELTEQSNFFTLETQSIIASQMLLKVDDIIINLFPPFDIFKINFNLSNAIVLSNFAIIRPIKIDSQILYFLLKQKIGNSANLLEGSLVKVLSLKILKEFQLDLSNLDRLKIMSLIDKKYDNLIALNLKKNHMLEKQKKYIIKYIGGIVNAR